jgi:stringent starvation protein B
MAEKSTKPYLLRAIHEWCSDSNFTPYLSVKVDGNTRVPMEFVKNGEIVLNIAYDATHRLTIGSDCVQFSARFSGVSRECSIPIEAVLGIFARENGQGLFFPAEESAAVPTPPAGAALVSETPEEGPATPPSSPGAGGRPKLQVVK